MVEATNLRSGNYISHIDGGIYQVKEIREGNVAVTNTNGTGELLLDNWRPIPLIPKILMKGKFRFSGKYFEKNIHPTATLRNSFSSMKRVNLKYNLENSILIIDNTINLSIINLHELQNVVFHLSGEELKMQF